MLKSVNASSCSFTVKNAFSQCLGCCPCGVWLQHDAVLSQVETVENLGLFTCEDIWNAVITSYILVKNTLVKMCLVLLLNKYHVIGYWNFGRGIGIFHSLLILRIASGDVLFKVNLQLILI